PGSDATLVRGIRRSASATTVPPRCMGEKKKRIWWSLARTRMREASPYVELRCRSAFSFLDGASLPEDLAARAAALGYPARALGDRDGLYGAPRFWKAAGAAGVRPLVAAEVTVGERPTAVSVPGGATPSSRETVAIARSRGDRPISGRLLLLAESRVGYRNLSKLLTLGHHGMPKGESVVSLRDVEAHAGGLLCLAGSGASPLTVALRRGDRAAALALGDRLRSVFARRLWIDVQRSCDRAVERRTRALTDLAGALRVPIVASGDVRHALATERPILDVLTCLRRGATLDAVGRSVLANAERHLVAPAEMTARFR